MTLLTAIKIMKLGNKFGYIGIGMFFAAMMAYGINTTTVFGMVLSILLVIGTYLEAKHFTKMDEE